MPGIYISYPFCSQKCTYCNFASGVHPRALEERYWAALLSEVRVYAEGLGACDTVYLGGGTPSTIAPARLAELLAVIPGYPWREATIEAAPGTLTRDVIRAWRDAGINRVSLGVQSFVRGELARTGRRHTAEIVAAEIAMLRDGGVENFNLDLIAGLPGQTESSWLESLRWIEKLSPPHVSVYMLEIDEDSRLGSEILLGGSRYSALETPSEDRTAAFYETALERLRGLGIPRYEISNFAKPGFESLHNLKYWRLHPYLGFGADAHSFMSGRRWQNVESVKEYVERWERGESVRQEEIAAEPEEEKFFVGLRLAEGIHPDAADWARFRPAIERFVGTGLLEQRGERLRLTDRGVMLSNEVFQEFIQT